jgi:hypothetical protein
LAASLVPLEKSAQTYGISASIDTLGVVWVQRSIGAPSPQLVNGGQYEPVGWYLCQDD